MELGVDDLSTIEALEVLFNEGNEPVSPPDGSKTEPQVNPPINTEPKSDKSDDKPEVDQTKAFAKRLKDSTDKARKEEQEHIAAVLGYKSYDELVKANENKLLKDNGLDPEQVSPIVEQLVEKRLNNDPRLKELELLKQKQVQEFAKRELAEVSKLAGVEFTSADQLPKDVVEDWKKTGSLKKSYMALHGEELILKTRHELNKGSLDHLKSPAGSAPEPSNQRPLNTKEKALWKLFNRDITDEELNNKTTNI